MIVLIKRKNAVLILLILFLSIAIFSLDSGGNPITQASTSDKGPLVIVDAGHGGEDPGKVSNYSGIAEKDLNLRIAVMLQNLLEQDGYSVIMTRTDDILCYSQGTTDITDKRRQDLTTRKKLIDTSGADIAVSIHLNDFTDPKYYGAQTFFPPDSLDSERLAVSIQKNLVSMVDPANTRVALVKKEKIVILKNLVVPTALVECGFLSNQAEEEKLRQVDYQENLAQAVKEGIDAYFGK